MTASRPEVKVPESQISKKWVQTSFLLADVLYFYLYAYDIHIIYCFYGPDSLLNFTLLGL